VLHLADRAKGGIFGLSSDRVAHNARLLFEPCLPWAVGMASYGSTDAALAYGRLHAPWPVAAIQVVGGVAFLAALAAGGACVFVRRVPWPVRRFALAGGVGLVATLAGFLASPLVLDLLR